VEAIHLEISGATMPGALWSIMFRGSLEPRGTERSMKN